MNANAMGAGAEARAVYEAPQLKHLGVFNVETKTWCVWGKTLGGYDGVNFDNMQMPISNCSG